MFSFPGWHLRVLVVGIVDFDKASKDNILSLDNMISDLDVPYIILSPFHCRLNELLRWPSNHT